jgi:protein phosphatase 2C-like protein
MNADCVFRMGRSHAVCQDYAVAGGGAVPYVILADGCSSSPDTDIGARLLVKSAERRLLDPAEPGTDWEMAADLRMRRAVDAARGYADMLGLSACCLDATLLTATVRGDSWQVSIHGDGVAAFKERGGLVHIHSISYTEGFPDYPNYTADPERRRAFRERTGNRRRLERMVLEPDGSLVETSVSLDGAFGQRYEETGKVVECEWIAVTSDGVSSFTSPAGGEPTRSSTSVPAADVLRELLAFKSTAGVFVQRRVQRFLRECESRGWQHQDDLAVGAITFHENGSLHSG